jgi:hypothetical protein
VRWEEPVSDHHREESEHGEIEHFEASHKRCCDNGLEKFGGIVLIAGWLVARREGRCEHSFLRSSVMAYEFHVENAFSLGGALHDRATECGQEWTFDIAT